MSVLKAPQWDKDVVGDSACTTLFQKQKKSKDSSNGILGGKIHKKYKKSKLKVNKKFKEDRVQKYKENSAKQHHSEISQVNKVSSSSIKNKLNGKDALHKKKKKRKKSKLNSSSEMQSKKNEVPNGISSVKSNNLSKNNSKFENKDETSIKNIVNDNKNQDKSSINKKKIKKNKKHQVENQNSYNSNHQNGVKVKDISSHSTSCHSDIENNNNKQPLKKYPQIENSNLSEKTAVNNVIKPVIQRDSKKKQKLKTKLQMMLAQQSETTKVEKKQPTTLRERMMEKLKAARFRYLNEQMYSQSGKEAKNLFKKDPDSFEAYHEGYQQQVKKWPLNPVDVIIKSLKKMPKTHVIADLGCGDAAISKSIEQKVHSFDLVAINDLVTACDMAHTPLENDSVDVTVFCLSLMGTNLHDYLLEANRILKIGGIMKIAEVESRFDNIESFIQIVERFGFKSTWKDLSHNLFYFLDFRKVQHVKNKKKVPSVSLKPCIYKKR